MLYIATALYEEAAPFLDALSLKKEPSFRHFDLFIGDTAMLLLTRTGALRAAAAVSSMLTAYPPQKNDLFLSAGTAACLDLDIPAGSAFIPRQITDAPSGRNVYPELVYRAPFPEAGLITVPQVITAENAEKIITGNTGQSSFAGQHDTDNNGTSGNGKPRFTELHGTDDNRTITTTSVGYASVPMLYDMESSGIYEAAIPHFSCERLLFFRVVSDHAADLPKSFAADTAAMERFRGQITAYMARHAGTVIDWAMKILNHLEIPPRLPETHTAFLERACAALRLSTASRAEFKRLMFYLYLNGTDDIAAMEHLLLEPLSSPCRTKKEGLAYLGQLKEYFL